MIEAGYNKQGGLNTQTQGMGGMPSFQVPSLPFDPSAAMREKLRIEAEDKAYERSMRERAIKQEEMRYRAEQQRRDAEDLRNRNAMSNREGAPPAADPLAAIKAQDRYEMTQRSAAMRPTGLGAQMIPGMAADPRLLPSRMRPQGSSFQGTAGPSMAGISPDAPPPPPTSNRGFDFADPYSQSRIQQSAFGKR